MKKTLLLLLLLITGSLFAPAYAQVGLGVKAGLNISDCAGPGCDLEVESFPKAGINVGVFGSFGISRWLTFQPEVQYSAQGVQGGDFTTIDEVTGTEIYVEEVILSNNYINIPLLLAIYPIRGFYVQIGPQVGFLVQSTAEATRTVGGLFTESVKSDTREAYTSYDFGVLVGLGYDFRPGITLEARYAAGLIDITHELDEADRNAVFQLNLGYRIVKNRN